ncbi:MAG: YkgJ family cysteine cluster protein [Syntrophales bacterium]|nr:YkgJ family cysteine cluster protein [Syntrophales bacterium]MDD5642448.1 YkgJ family cysteine cluster protein [Syntrophales bacterium]
MKSKIWEFFECQRCGKCCEQLGLPWDPFKVHEIAEYLDINLDELITRYYGSIIEKDGEKFYELRDELTRPCRLLGKDKSCLIHQVKPGPCEDYPIETDFGDSGIDCPAYKKAIKAYRRKRN